MGWVSYCKQSLPPWNYRRKTNIYQALAIGITQVSASMSKELKNNTLETLKASGAGYSNKIAKLSQQNQFMLPICFMEHCPALSTGVNEIKFQKSTGKENYPSLCSTLYCILEETTESSFETAVRALPLSSLYVSFSIVYRRTWDITPICISCRHVYYP